jgi:DNA-binding IclR family transcriptional regulator
VSSHRPCLQTRERGVSLIQDTINFGVTAVGHPFYDSLGQVIGALSVAALSQRMTHVRIHQISGLLQTACAEVEGRLRGQVRAGWRAG